MAENALRWLMMGVIYLEVIGYLGAALIVLLGGDMDFNIVDGFVMVLETGSTLVLVNVNGLGGGGGGGQDAERNDGFKQVLPSDLNTLDRFSCIRNCSAQC